MFLHALRDVVEAQMGASLPVTGSLTAINTPNLPGVCDPKDITCLIES